jgi:ParB family chromosome partitioning protein
MKDGRTTATHYKGSNIMADIRIEQIPLNQIDWPENERKHFDVDALAMLAESIKVHGLKQPIGVVADADGRYRGLWGQRRLKAAALAGLATIPAIIHPMPKDEIEAAEIRLCENVAREALTPIELANGLNKLMAGGGTATQIAARVGMSGPAVSRAMSLLTLSPAHQQHIQDGRISAAAGDELAQSADLSVRDELARQAAEGKITRDGLIARRKQPAPTAVEPNITVSRATAKLGDDKSVTVFAPALDLEMFVETLEQTLSRAREARRKHPHLQLHTFLRILRDTAAL